MTRRRPSLAAARFALFALLTAHCTRRPPPLVPVALVSSSLALQLSDRGERVPTSPAPDDPYPIHLLADATAVECRADLAGWRGWTCQRWLPPWEFHRRALFLARAWRLWFNWDHPRSILSLASPASIPNPNEGPAYVACADPVGWGYARMRQAFLPALLVESMSEAAIAINAQHAAQSAFNSSCVEPFLRERDASYARSTYFLLLASAHLESASESELSKPGVEHMRQYVRLLLGTATLPFDDPTRLSCAGWSLACAALRARREPHSDQTHPDQDREDVARDPRCALAMQCDPISLFGSRISVVRGDSDEPSVGAYCSNFPLEDINVGLTGRRDFAWERYFHDYLSPAP